MSANLIRNTRPARPLAEDPIKPELINPCPETLLAATVKLLRDHLPQYEFKVEIVTTNEAVISHRTKDHRLEFFRLKLTR